MYVPVSLYVNTLISLFPDFLGISWIRAHWISGIIIALLIDRECLLNGMAQLIEKAAVMLQIRVYAFYGRSKYILSILAIAFIATGGVMFTLACVIISKESGQ